MKKEYMSPEWDFVSIKLVDKMMTPSEGEGGAQGGDPGGEGGGGFGEE